MSILTVPNKEFQKDIALKNFAMLPFDKPVVFSHEHLSGNPHGFKIPPNQYDIAKNLHSIFPQAKILIIVREQLSWLLSMYTYDVTVKGNPIGGLKAMISNMLENNIEEKICYDRLLKHYIRLFGSNSVLVIPLEQLRFEVHLKNISRIIDCDITFLKTKEKINRSVKSARVLNIAEKLNNLRIDHKIPKSIKTPYRNARLKFYRILSLYFLERLTTDHLRGELSETFISIIAESNRRLEKLTNLNLKMSSYIL